ncbi:MAG TPA: hydrogenase maturation nickel metallochaperone HypA [Gammaproteobacteria bacterium]
MHEMSLAEGILQILEQNSRSQGFARVTRVRLELGRLSHVEPEALAFCFEVVARDTLAAGAVLELLRVDGQGWCEECAASVPIDSHYAACPRCGGYRVATTGGTEMRVKELEVE